MFARSRIRTTRRFAAANGLAGLVLAVAHSACAGDGSQTTTAMPASGTGGSDATSAPLPGAGAGVSAPTTAGSGGDAVRDASSPDDGGGAGQSGSAGADTGEAGASSDAAVPDGGEGLPRLPPAPSVDADGVFATSQDLATGPRGDSGLFHPTELGKDGVKHPIFVWGCGGGSSPSSYAAHLNRIASHGFVAIAEVSRIGDDGDVLIASLDWLLAENDRPDSVLYDTLDTTRIAAGGHSIGSVNTFLMADDPRLRTTIHVAGGSLDDVNDPFAPTSGLGGKALVHPAAFICAESDAFGNVEKTEADYAATTAPVFFTVITGADHVGAAREGLPVMVAWLRWHLGGEDARSSMFLEPSGEFRTGKYVSQSKNW
jgi:hypothetical protein